MKNIKDITLTIQRGGMIAFEKTGVYPEFLVFNCKSLKRTWRVKLKDDKQQGILKRNGVVAFTYFFDGLGCKMENVVNGVVVQDWNIEEIVMEMRD
jgi:hypothetical protein